MCYPKSVKTNRELQNGTLLLNVRRGDQLDVEYSKEEIIDKINSFFGYKFIKKIKIELLDEKINTKNNNLISGQKNKYIQKKIDKIHNLKLKKKLADLIKEFEAKNLK